MNQNQSTLFFYIALSLVESWNNKTLCELFNCNNQKYKNLTIGNITTSYTSGDYKTVFFHTGKNLRLFFYYDNKITLKIMFQTTGVSDVFVDDYDVTNLFDNIEDTI